MEEFEFSEENVTRGQEEIDIWFKNLPGEATQVLHDLEEKVVQMETFDLLSNISLYNHTYDTQEYTDYRGDRMHVTSELLALIALKRNYQHSSVIDANDAMAHIKEVQDLGSKYLSIMTIVQMRVNDIEDHHSMAGIALRTMRDETYIRNPGLPEHHLMFSSELYAPIETEIKNKFGFSIQESITIRKTISILLNDRIDKVRKDIHSKTIELFSEVFKFRSTKIVPENSLLTQENLEELNKLSRKQIREVCFNHCVADLYFHLGRYYCFTVKDLAEFSNLDEATVEHFVKHFSCTFPSVPDNDQLISPNSILKSRPLVIHEGKILVPSYPLLTWCVEPLIEKHLRSVPKLGERFKNTKHDFLLKKGTDLFSTIFNDKIEIFTNLYYYENENKENRFETDAIFRYERTLFIIEAKGQRFSQPAKEGKIIRTEAHMKEIVRDSYMQGLRTLKYIRSKPTAAFSTEKKKMINFSRNDVDNIVLISLILEPIGNVIPLIRTSNELGFFENDVFPWIISIYDLQVIADHLEMPILLPHYIKRRQEFLSKKNIHVFEEADLLSYYLFNRLYIEKMLRDAEEEDADMIYLENGTDEISNYYMQKFRNKIPNPPKLKLNLPEIFKKILTSIEKSRFSHRQAIMMAILDLSPQAIEKFKEYIEKLKFLFFTDGKIHDCSILSNISGKKVGFTFMTGPNVLELDKNLYAFCRFKGEETKADAWIGFGDTNRIREEFEIESGFIAGYDQE